MRSYYNECKIEGKPILAPDRDVGLSKQDLDAEGSGRDEQGYLHRIVLRSRVNKWSFKYSSLTYEEYEYMETLLSKPEFTFDFSYGSKRIRTKAYCASISASLRNANTGTYKNVSFNIVEC